MNLKNLSDDQLLANTQELVKQERNVITQVLHHLRETEARRLFAKLDHSSLYVYCIKVLKYSEGQAQRRISAMRLLREIPEVEEKLSTGELSLSNIAYAVSFFRQEAKQVQKPLQKQHKKQVLKQLENCSSRQGQKVLLSLSSNPEQAIKQNLERQRVVTSQITQISFGADEQLLQKLNRLKGLLAHKKPNIGTAELVNELCEIGLMQLDPLRKKAKTTRRKSNTGKEEKSQKTNSAAAHVASEVGLHQNKSAHIAPNIELHHGKSVHVTSEVESHQRESVHLLPEVRRHHNKRKHISASIRRAVWQRANGQCENCQSQYALEIDHRCPVSLGGANDLDNLRILCRSCNQRAAIEKLGRGHMRQYLT